MSLEDLKKKLEHEAEKNAFLESELDEKSTTMTVTVQRLREEARGECSTRREEGGGGVRRWECGVRV